LDLINVEGRREGKLAEGAGMRLAASKTWSIECSIQIRYQSLYGGTFHANPSKLYMYIF